MSSGRVTINGIGYKLLPGGKLHVMKQFGPGMQIVDKDGDVLPLDDDLQVTLTNGQEYTILQNDFHSKIIFLSIY